MTLKRPFDASTLPALVMKIMKGSFDPVPEIYSQELKNLLMNMLNLDPNQRPTAAQIMCEPFMVNVLFKLFVDIGSIPCTNRSQKSKPPLLKSGTSDSSSLEYESNADSLQSKYMNEKKEQNVWLFESKSSSIIPLPPVPKECIKNVCLGMNHKIAVTANGLVASWNVSSPCILIEDMSNNYELVKAPTYVATIVDEKFAVNIVSVASGNDFTVCLSDNGVLFTFGKGSSGCLGYSSKKEIQQPRIVEALFSHNISSVACGPRHVLALTEESEIFGWGFGDHGCLGLGRSELQIIPQLIPLELGGEKPEKIFCGIDCSFIVTSKKSLLACGNNRHNKLALDSGEGNHIDEAGTFMPIQSEPLPNCKITAVSAGKSHSVILTENGEVYSVGSNHYCQLGWGKPGLDYSLPEKIEKLKDFRIIQIACSNFFTLAVTDDKYLFCWGKCPKSLMSKKEKVLFDVEMPPLFREKSVMTVACDSENCLIVGEDRFHKCTD